MRVNWSASFNEPRYGERVSFFDSTTEYFWDRHSTNTKVSYAPRLSLEAEEVRFNVGSYDHTPTRRRSNCHGIIEAVPNNLLNGYDIRSNNLADNGANERIRILRNLSGDCSQNFSIMRWAT
jgi:hypothetical protein